MRPIKFRAWHTEDKVMVYDLNSPSLFRGELKTPDDDYIFMQFTGLYDANNKKIFEGDLVRGVPIKWRDEFEAIKEVVFNDGKFCLEWTLHISEEVVFISLDCFKLEIVGNIYESTKLSEVAS